MFANDDEWRNFRTRWPCFALWMQILCFCAWKLDVTEATSLASRQFSQLGYLCAFSRFNGWQEWMWLIYPAFLIIRDFHFSSFFLFCMCVCLCVVWSVSEKELTMTEGSHSRPVVESVTRLAIFRSFFFFNFITFHEPTRHAHILCSVGPWAFSNVCVSMPDV